MRFTVLLLAMLAATAAHSHDKLDLTVDVTDWGGFPLPFIEQMFPVEDRAAAFQWADKPPAMGRELGNWWRYYTSEPLWLVVEVSEAQFRQMDAFLASIQRPLSARLARNSGCAELDGRFGFYLSGYSRYSFLRTSGNHLWHREQAHAFPYSLSENRFTPLISFIPDPNSSSPLYAWQENYMQFAWVLIDNVGCELEHTTHSDGSADHSTQRHEGKFYVGPWTAWMPGYDLLAGYVADNDAPITQLRAELAALRDSLQSAAGGTTTTITRVDTVHFCPTTDEDRQNLFDAFTGVNSDTTGGAGKATAVRPSSWGQIKALIREE